MRLMRMTCVLLLVVVAAAWTWGLSHSDTPEAAFPWMIGGVVGGLVMGKYLVPGTPLGGEHTAAEIRQVVTNLH